MMNGGTLDHKKIEFILLLFKYINLRRENVNKISTNTSISLSI